MVLIDNGRGRMREDPVLHEALYCIRCSACLNSCANFETVAATLSGRDLFWRDRRFLGGGHWQAAQRALQRTMHRLLAVCAAMSGADRHSLAQ